MPWSLCFTSAGSSPTMMPWERYESRAKVIVAAGLSDETKAKVLGTVRKHAAALEGMQEQVA
jgi:hypothetical protein